MIESLGAMIETETKTEVETVDQLLIIRWIMEREKFENSNLKPYDHCVELNNRSVFTFLMLSHFRLLEAKKRWGLIFMLEKNFLQKRWRRFFASNQRFQRYRIIKSLSNERNCFFKSRIDRSIPVVPVYTKKRWLLILKLRILEF